VKRKNIGSDTQIDIIHEIQKRGKTATTELIIPLPGESENSYFEGMKFLMDNNVMTGTYTLMMLCGAELGRDAAIKRNGMISKYRVLPKQFGQYSGEKIFEFERFRF
jgi:radical SAM superfamily enzyme